MLAARIGMIASRSDSDARRIGWVYFMCEREDASRDGSGGRLTDFIKIGWTAEDPQDRLASLQTGNPRPLEVIAAYSGTQRAESQLHEHFCDVRVYDSAWEWFRRTARPADRGRLVQLRLLGPQPREVRPSVQEFVDRCLEVKHLDLAWLAL